MIKKYQLQSSKFDKTKYHIILDIILKDFKYNDNIVNIIIKNNRTSQLIYSNITHSPNKNENFYKFGDLSNRYTVYISNYLSENEIIITDENITENKLKCFLREEKLKRILES